MADATEDLGDLTEDAEAGVEVGLEAEAEAYSVLVRFVTDTSISEGAALNFLERVKEHYGFPYEPGYTLGGAGHLNWNDRDDTKRGMARTYRILGLPTEDEANKFAGELEVKKGVEWAYREIPIEIDDDDPYLNPSTDVDDRIENLMKR